MISIFAIPKPFLGDDEKRQRNALESWVSLPSNCEVILFGDGAGIEETSKEFGTKWIKEIKRNEFGTPLLDDAFEKAENAADYNILCYANADIILFDDLLKAVGTIPFDRFLGSSKRYNVDLLYENELKKIEGCPGLKEYVRKEVTLDDFNSMDIFLFPKKTGFDLPAYAVGRPGWDHWLIFRARQLRIPVIDLTDIVTVVHQVHDYKHVPQSTGYRWRGPEGDENLRLIGDFRKKFNLQYATHELTQTGLQKTKRRKLFRIWWNEKILLYPKWKVPLRILASITLFLQNLLKGDNR